MTVRDPAMTRIALELWAETGRRTRLPVRGFSMWPVLRSGEVVSVRHGGARPEVGQIIVVLDGDRTVAHRVIETRGSGAQLAFQTKGDTCLTADRSLAAADRIIGVIEGVVEGEVVIRRFGMEGRWGFVLALLSRAQGILCAPLRSLAVWLIGRRNRHPGIDR